MCESTLKAGSEKKLEAAPKCERCIKLESNLEQLKSLVEAERQRFGETQKQMRGMELEIRELTLTIRMLTKDRLVLQAQMERLVAERPDEGG